MAQYDLYPAPDGRGYLLDVQTNFLFDLNIRVVVPLLPEEDAPDPARRLNPLVEIEGVRHMMATQFLATVPETALKGRVTTLSERSDEITRALDMLFQGF